jgi:RNA polymerase sigma-70 factor (ECF subfamily)
MSIFNDHEADNALIKATVEGDERAFGLLYRKYQYYVLCCAKAILGSDHASAWDVVQDTFIKARKALGSYAPVNFAGWLRTIAQHTAINFIRDQRRRNEILEREVLFLQGERHEDPLEHLEGKRNRAMIMSAVDTLSHDHREIVLLWAQGYLYKDIAEMLGIRLGTVMSRLNRARNVLLDMPIRTAA